MNIYVIDENGQIKLSTAATIDLTSLDEKLTVASDDVYPLQEADGDVFKQRYDVLMEEAFQRSWFYGG